MIVSTYTQNKKLQNQIAKIGRYVNNPTSKDFGLYYLDIQSEVGGARNNHNVKPTKDIKDIEKWLADNGFHKIG